MAGRKAKRASMSNKAFAELIESLEQALAYDPSARAGYRVTRVKVPHHQATGINLRASRSQRAESDSL